MSQKMEKFFAKHDFTSSDIKYIVREDGKTVVYLIGGRTVQTYNTVKEFREHLPIDDFLYPNKGVVLAASQIMDVSDGAYQMADGRVFKYRVHNSQRHDSRMLMLGRRLERVQAVADALTPETLASRYALLDNMPLGVTVIEMLFNEHGHGIDFVFRYCNDKLLELDRMEREEVIGKSYLEVFENADKRWLVTFADVALNNTSRVLTDYVMLGGQRARVWCYQPLAGFCACVMLPYEEALQAVVEA